MNKEEAIRQLLECQKNSDMEEAHVKADEILCRLLISLGLHEVAAEYDKVHKHYA